jgi:hypothetical protein
VLVALIAVHLAAAAFPAFGAEAAGTHASSRITPESIANHSVPFKIREPREFWINRQVHLKQPNNNVIEDQDYVVRERYWTLDASSIGTVVGVTLVEDTQVLRVRFDNRNGWSEHGLEKREGVAVQQQSTVTPNGNGGVDMNSESTVRRIEGERLFDEDECGVIIEQSDNITIVECPSVICTLPKPSVGELVTRGPDWQGFADGGNRRYGPNTGKPETFAGEVIEEIDRDNLVDIKWKKTGRISACRFDASGFYDIVVIPDSAPVVRRRNVDAADDQ